MMYIPLLVKVAGWASVIIKGLDVVVKGSKLVPTSVFKASSWMTLNVGGVTFLTTKQTLLLRDSVFVRLLAEDEQKKSQGRLSKAVDYVNPFSTPSKKKSAKDTAIDFEKYFQIRKKTPNMYYIDRDPTYFRPVLNFLRHGHFIRDYSVNLDGIMREAAFYEVTELVEKLEEMGASPRPPPVDSKENENTRIIEEAEAELEKHESGTLEEAAEEVQTEDVQATPTGDSATECRVGEGENDNERVEGDSSGAAEEPGAGEHKTKIDADADGDALDVGRTQRG